MLNGLSVNAYNSASNCFYPAVIRKSGNQYVLAEAEAAARKPDYYLTPGWIDLHTHIFDGFGVFGINADEIGWQTGVCLVVDAGTVGEYTLPGFRKYVEPTIRTNFRLFLCISPAGILNNIENRVMECFNLESTVNAVKQNRDIICGIKVRIGKEVSGPEGIEPLRLASQAARLTGLPLMVHIGANPPYLTDVEPFLAKGDILTHCFNGRGGDGWNPDGTPAAAMRKLLDRGVILDVGHGGGSFSFAVCAKALRHGLPKFNISTDLHAFSRGGCVVNMATTLTKMLGLALPLEDVIYGVTALPAQILQLQNWCDLSVLNNATLFRIRRQPGAFPDSQGELLSVDRVVATAGVFLNGGFHLLD
ncbi:MAG TPA: hypothetical protein DD640_03995 [Clostridiales bacterium]|nr:hypothetical protein [Clostridiales bacterium]